MENLGTNQPQNVEQGSNSSPALDALNAPNQNVDPTQTAQPIKTIPDGDSLFNQMNQALEPGMFDGDTGLNDVPSSNDPTNPTPTINTDPNSPIGQVATLADPMRQVIPADKLDIQPDPNVQNRQPNEPDINQRYSESSREAKRLAIENRQLQDKMKAIEPIMPLVMKLKESEPLRNIVKGYYSKGGAMPVDIKKQLNLPEDFVFDGNEAFDDPKSDSAKLLSSTIDMYAFSRTEQMRDEIRKETVEVKAKERRDAELAQFRTKNNIDDAKMDDMNHFMKTHPLTYDDINYLMARGSRERNVAQNAQLDVINQMKNVREMPTSLSGQKTETLDINSEEARYNLAFGKTDDGQGIFGGEDS